MYHMIDQTARLATSARPDAPQLADAPERTPGRARVRVAAVLHRAGDRLATRHEVLAAR